MRSAGAAVLLFLASCPLLWRGQPDGDVVELRGYAQALLDGRLPYRDFHYEYPPGAIPFFTLPQLVAKGHYVDAFRAENALGWAVVVVLVALLAQRPWAPFAVALVPLALGPWTLMRFDAWPVALALAALVLLLRDRPVPALALLALGALVKVWPALLVPVFLAHSRSRRGAATFAAVAVAGLAPFAALAPTGAYNAFAQQVNRHLQIETLAASALLALGRPVRVFFDAGSWNVAGSGADRLAQAQSLLELAAVAVAVVVFARSLRTSRELAAACAATVTAAAVLGKVLSPQYLLWAAPFLVLTPLALVPFAGACLLTRAYFPGRYDALLAKHDTPIALLAVRNALLVAAAVLVFASLRARAASG
jgi:hypothetical protein